ncbi:MAG: HypC/HybG/HupF family hydrogenase formation chaperone [Desulfobacterium sp.]|jgi:hydrogenase expression/formation protein HypC|nr:HypC/HybG/HupF family hydrogenase formation chaperone [Desulfobacterium sp.]
MCLAIPSRIVEINDNVATVDVDGVTREASLMLLDNVTIGEYVIVHAGFAIERIHEEVALQTLEDMREMVRLVSNDDQGV